MLKPLFESVKKEIDIDWMMKQVEALWKLEIGQRSQDKHRAAVYAEQLMKQSALEKVKRISFPADGKTAYQDRVMPLAWNITVGRLTVKKSPVPFSDPVVADYQRHPFHVINGSVATPKTGLMTRLITEDQMFNGEKAEGAMVMLNADTAPRQHIYRAVCDFGALGIVVDATYSRYRFARPDHLPWINAFTEGNHWGIHADDRPFIGFTVTPRTGDQLRAAARAGEVLVQVLSDGRRYPGTIEAVTGLIPGSDKREVWLYAHLYEPLADDNSDGVISALEIARVMKRLIRKKVLPPPRFTLRLVFAMEMYGLSAFVEKSGGYMRDRVIGAMNLDGLPVSTSKQVTLNLAPSGSPFFGDYLLENMSASCQNEMGIRLQLCDEGIYGDDMFVNDSTSGLSMTWPLGAGELWHTSAQDMSIIDPVLLRNITAFNGAWTAALLTLDAAKTRQLTAQSVFYARKHLQEEASRIWGQYLSLDQKDKINFLSEAPFRMNLRLERETRRLDDFCRVGKKSEIAGELKALARAKDLILNDLLRRMKTPIKGRYQRPAANSARPGFAAMIVPSRATRGIPYDLEMIPKSERRELPDGGIYGPFAGILANMDGKKTLKELLREAEWEAGVRFSAQQIKKYIGAVEYLAEYGYLKTRYKGGVIRRKDIVAALRRAGVDRGDLIMLHSGLSGFGHIEGGADTVIHAFMEAIGPRGTLLLPAFTPSFIYFNGSCVKSKQARPYDPECAKDIWVGTIPQTFLKYKGVFRSIHPTHSVIGRGPLAKTCLQEHEETDPPTCRRSPFGKLLDYHGKMVWFGADLDSTTFFHFLEDEMNMPYLAEAVCRVKRPDGSIRTVLIPKHLPGHRDFYRTPGEKTKMYQWLLKNGLKIRKTKLGLGEIRLIDAAQMYDLGLKALRKDPDLLLCDNRECQFCRGFNRKLRP